MIFPTPNLDYTTRDYHGLREQLLNRLAVTLPDFEERNPADIEIMLIEIMAYLGDYLSYYQDAAATEAYLNTARSHISVKRHLRLLNYVLHQGYNSRAWVQITPSSDQIEATLIKKGSLVLSAIKAHQTIIAPDRIDRAELINQPVAAYELMHDVQCHPDNNQIAIYTWHQSNYELSKGISTFALVGWCNHLNSGDVILLEEIRSPLTGLQRDANPTKRHIMRIKQINLQYDKGNPITQLSCYSEDALPFDFKISTLLPNGRQINCCMASGNLVLADQGLTTEYSQFVWEQSSHHVKLDGSPIIFSEVYDYKKARTFSATRSIAQNAIYSLPALHLFSNYKQWRPQFDLLSSQRFSHDFVLEIENQTQKYLRFGNNDFGKTPDVGEQFKVIARCQTAYQEQLNRDQLVHLVTTNNHIVKVRNPLPGTVKKSPENNNKARKIAPEIYTKVFTCFNVEDYVNVLCQLPTIISVTGQLKQVNLQNTIILYVQRAHNQAHDPSFIQHILSYLKPYRYIGHQLIIAEPNYIPIALCLTINTSPGFSAEIVHKNLTLAFSAEQFFTPERFQLGSTLYYSQILEHVLNVAGVSNVDIVNSHSQLAYFGSQDQKNALEVNALTAKSFEILGGNQHIKNHFNFIVRTTNELGI